MPDFEHANPGINHALATLNEALRGQDVLDANAPNAEEWEKWATEQRVAPLKLLGVALQRIGDEGYDDPTEPLADAFDTLTAAATREGYRQDFYFPKRLIGDTWHSSSMMRHYLKAMMYYGLTRHIRELKDEASDDWFNMIGGGLLNPNHPEFDPGLGAELVFVKGNKLLKKGNVGVSGLVVDVAASEHPSNDEFESGLTNPTDPFSSILVFDGEKLVEHTVFSYGSWSVANFKLVKSVGDVAAKLSKLDR